MSAVDKNAWVLLEPVQVTRGYFLNQSQSRSTSLDNGGQRSTPIEGYSLFSFFAENKPTRPRSFEQAAADILRTPVHPSQRCLRLPQKTRDVKDVHFHLESPGVSLFCLKRKHSRQHEPAHETDSKIRHETGTMVSRRRRLSEILS